MQHREGRLCETYKILSRRYPRVNPAFNSDQFNEFNGDRVRVTPARLRFANEALSLPLRDFQSRYIDLWFPSIFAIAPAIGRSILQRTLESASWNCKSAFPTFPRPRPPRRTLSTRFMNGTL